LKLARYYYYGTILVCFLDLGDSIRILAGKNQSLDLAGAVIGTMVSVWVIVALLVLVESIRKEQAVPAALFYVVTMATFLITAPVLPNFAPITHVVEGTIMFANIVVHLWQLGRLRPPKGENKGD
jgi:hypothetical protein